MTIEITRPEIEFLIHQRLQSGAYMDAEDVILRALQSFTPEPEPVFDKQRALAAGAHPRIEQWTYSRRPDDRRTDR
jgi:hypothetical protein